MRPKYVLITIQYYPHHIYRHGAEVWELSGWLDGSRSEMINGQYTNELEAYKHALSYNVPVLRNSASDLPYDLCDWLVEYFTKAEREKKND